MATKVKCGRIYDSNAFIINLILSILNFLFGLFPQIDRFVEVAQMTAADVAERVEICRNVEATLAKAQFAVPGSVSVYPFGSSVNGLGFRGCDLDVYVEMNLNLRRATKDLDAHELSVRKVDVVAQVLRTIQQVKD